LPRLDDCKVTLLTQPCHANSTVALTPWSLELIDRYISLIYLIIGMGILAPLLLIATLAAVRSLGGTAGGGVIEEALIPLRNTLSRRLNIALTNLMTAVHVTARPVLILLGVACAALSARSIRFYLHLASDWHVCDSQSSCALLSRDFGYQFPDAGHIAGADVHATELQYLGLAVGAGLVGAVAIILALLVALSGKASAGSAWRGTGARRLVLLPPQTLSLLKTLGWLGFAVLITLWAFWVVLWAINVLLLQLLQGNVEAMRKPFTEIGWPTGISLGAMLLSAALYLLQRRRSRARVDKPAP
jgi:hypothetical protein